MFDSNSNTHIDKKKFILLFGTITKITSNDVNIFHGGVGKKFQTPFDLFHFHVIYTPLSYIHFTGRKNVEI